MEYIASIFTCFFVIRVIPSMFYFKFRVDHRSRRTKPNEANQRNNRLAAICSPPSADVFMTSLLTNVQVELKSDCHCRVKIDKNTVIVDEFLDFICSSVTQSGKASVRLCDTIRNQSVRS